MTVVTIRCHECDTVKPEEEVEIGANGNTCQDCKTDVPDGADEAESTNSDEPGVSKEEIAESEADGAEDSDRDNESGESDENAEGDKKPLEESFSEQDPLEW